MIIDDAIANQDLQKLYLYVGLMIILPIIAGLIGVGQTWLNTVIGQRVMRDLREQLYSHLQRMPLRFFTETRTGEIQSRLTNDVGGVQRVVTDTATSIVATWRPRSRRSSRCGCSTGVWPCSRSACCRSSLS